MNRKDKSSQNKAGSRYILIVDDEVQVIRAIIRELSEWAKDRDITVTGAVIGKEALDFLEQHADQVELIIADMRMPGMPGGEMLLEIQRRYPHIATILLTAYTDREELAKAVRAGIFSYIPKPWETEQLIEEIEKALTFRENELEKEEFAHKLYEQFKAGGEFQRETLHVDLPESDKIRFSLLHLPADYNYCNGDYYDVISLDSGRYLVLLGDASGNPLMGAFVTIILKLILSKEFVIPRSGDGKPFSPASFLEWLNNRVFGYLKRFELLIVSFAAIVIDTQHMKMTYALADHTPLACIRNKEFIFLNAEGTGLGIIKDLTFKEKEFALQGGDKLLFMSDGLAHHLSAKIDEHPLSQSKIATEAETGEDFLERFKDIILRENAKGIFEDDVTLISAELS